MKIKISTPNDYNSSSDYNDALLDSYGYEDLKDCEHACEQDNAEAMLNKLSDAAIEAGLTWVAETDYGSEWEGSKEECENAQKALPSWAYVSFDESEIEED